MEKVCCICNEKIREGEEIEYSGKYYCEECAEEELSTCKHCNEVGLKDDMFYVDDNYYCGSCYDNLFVTCEECGEVISVDDAEYYDGTPYCNECYINCFTTCAGCDNDIPNNETYYDDDTDAYYCEDCYRELTNNIIKDYHERDIDLEFKKLVSDNTELYLGFELEVENGNVDNEERNNDARYIRTHYPELGLCFEHDGSLDYGFEIISQPMTMNYIYEHKEDFKAILKYLDDKGYQSHNGGRCGLHIHISKKAFGEVDSDTLDKNIKKLLLFTETYKNELITFSRRQNFHYCEFISSKVKSSYDNMNKDIYYKSGEVLQGLNKRINRYQVVNLENSNTIELRVFRGTLKFETFMATLEFVNSLTEVIVNKAIRKINFDKVVTHDKRALELKEYCDSKGIFNSAYMVDESENVKKIINKQYSKYNSNIDKTTKAYSKAYDTISKALENKGLEKALKDKDKNALSSYGNLLKISSNIAAKNMSKIAIDNTTSLADVLLNNTNNLNNKQRLINDYQSMTIENLSYIRDSLPESNTELISMYDSIINTLTTIVNEMTEELEDIDREER